MLYSLLWGLSIIICVALVHGLKCSIDTSAAADGYLDYFHFFTIINNVKKTFLYLYAGVSMYIPQVYPFI